MKSGGVQGETRRKPRGSIRTSNEQAEVIRGCAVEIGSVVESRRASARKAASKEDVAVFVDDREVKGARPSENRACDARDILPVRCDHPAIRLKERLGW